MNQCAEERDDWWMVTSDGPSTEHWYAMKVDDSACSSQDVLCSTTSMDILQPDDSVLTAPKRLLVHSTRCVCQWHSSEQHAMHGLLHYVFWMRFSISLSNYGGVCLTIDMPRRVMS